METIKSYTDLSQSKKLAEILPLESADGYWFKGFPAQPYMIYTKGTPNPGEHISCWSLAVLLDVLPVGTESHKQSDGSISYYHVEVYNNKKYFSTKRYNNLIDACYEMIIKLHELKML